MMTVASAKPTPFFIRRPVNQARNTSPMWKGSRKFTPYPTAMPRSMTPRIGRS